MTKSWAKAELLGTVHLKAGKMQKSPMVMALQRSADGLAEECFAPAPTSDKTIKDFKAMPAEGSPSSKDQARPQGQGQMLGRILKLGRQDAE